MFDQILIAHDGSDSARKAFDVAVEITAKLGARLRMICVEEEIPRHAEVIDELREEKDRADSYFGQLAEHCRMRAAMHSVTIESVIVPGHAVKVIGDFSGRIPSIFWSSALRDIPGSTSTSGVARPTT